MADQQKCSARLVVISEACSLATAILDDSRMGFKNVATRQFAVAVEAGFGLQLPRRACETRED
jgi:hypothetical protein